MSDFSPLAELARLASTARSPDLPVRSGRRQDTNLAVEPKAQRRSVGELLGVVLVLSARTRRAMQPRARIELDVFSPEGGRAPRIQLGA